MIFLDKIFLNHSLLALIFIPAIYGMEIPEIKTQSLNLSKENAALVDLIERTGNPAPYYEALSIYEFSIYEGPESLNTWKLTYQQRQVALRVASYMCDKDIMEFLIERKTSLRYKYENKLTPLQQAARSGYTEDMALLLAHNANLNETNYFGNTPLHEAVREGHTKIVKLLLAHNANLNKTNYFGNTPLHWAAKNRATEIVRLLISSGALLNEKDKYGNTPLHLAAHAGHTEIVKLLLEYKANVNEKDKYGNAPLRLAARAGHTEIVKLLLEYKANVNEKGKDDYTPLLDAARAGHTKIVELLLEYKADPNEKDGYGNTLMHWAAEKGHMEIVKLLHEYKANPNEKARYGNTPLHCAAHAGHTEIVKLLLSRGALLNEKGSNGKTLLHLATESRDTEIVRLLISSGALLNEKDEYGKTPLHLATESSDTEIVRLLISSGALLNEKDEYGNTPLHLAAQHGTVEIIKLLLLRGADIHIKNNWGYTAQDGAFNRKTELAHAVKREFRRTPLHLAAKIGDETAVKMFLETGADVNARDKKTGETPLHLASYYNHLLIAKILLENGASIDRMDRLGYTALTRALLRKNEELAELLLWKNASIEAGYLSPIKLGKCGVDKKMLNLVHEGKIVQSIAALLKNNETLHFPDIDTCLESEFFRTELKKLLDQRKNAKRELPPPTPVRINDLHSENGIGYEMRLKENYTDTFSAGLALDGEGLQALITASMVKRLEDELGPLHQVFDYITGSSFGGIVALALVASADGNRRAIKTKDIIKLFENDAQEIFPAKSKKSTEPYYPLDPLKEKLKLLFKHTRLCDSLTRVIVPFDGANKEFDSLRAQEEVAMRGMQTKENYYLRDIAGILGADSKGTYFPPIEFNGQPVCASERYSNASADFLNKKLAALSGNKPPKYRILYCVSNSLVNPHKTIDNELRNLNTSLDENASLLQERIDKLREEISGLNEKNQKNALSEKEKKQQEQLNAQIEALSWEKNKTTISRYECIKPKLNEEMPLDDKKAVSKYKELGLAAAQQFIEKNPNFLRLLKENRALKHSLTT